MPNKYIGTQEVMRRLKISRTTVYRLMEKGLLHPLETPPYLTKVAKLEFLESEVESLLNKPTPDEPVKDLAGVA